MSSEVPSAPHSEADANGADAAVTSGSEAPGDSTDTSPTEAPLTAEQPGDGPSDPEQAAEAGSDPLTHRFECRSCGFVYDPAEGIRKLDIAPGTPFQDLDPVAFRCPVCRSRVGAFRDIGPRSKPSGFEENLDFGLGVNRLTPGQKNVLIFGGFALAIAFFLSLYSLR